MNLIKYFLIISVMCGVLFAGAKPAKAKLTPCSKSTGDEIILTHGHPYLGGSRSPGDSIGMTGLEYQANGGCEKRIYVDDSFQVHVTWMSVPFPFMSMAQRCMKVNFRYNDGSYFGDFEASPYTSGYGSLDLTQDTDVAMQRTVISYHFNTGTNAYYPFYDVDAGNLFGAFPNDPKNPPNSHYLLWPMVAATKSGNYILATDDNAGNYHHCFTTTDNGTTWTNPFNSDSCATISQFIMASRMSNKVGYVETRFITDSVAAGQLDADVWYRISTDGGVTWGPNTNLTHYQPADTFRAYCSVSCNFDQNDNFHIVWAARRVQNGEYYDASKILHWDEVHNQITVVSHSTGLFTGGWWGWTHPNGFGSWRLPADEPLLAYDDSTWLYCFWCGQNDTADFSLAGWPNGDIYIARSHDGGLTWNMWTNLTNTHTPGAPAGSCEDEDYIAVCPYTKRDSLFITYIEDKDAGAITQTEGDTTNNIVRLWFFHKNPWNIEENNIEKPQSYIIKLNPNPTRSYIDVQYILPVVGKIDIRLYGIDGRLIKIIDQGVKYSGFHKIQIDIRELPGGTYFVILETPERRMTEKLVVVK